MVIAFMIKEYKIPTKTNANQIFLVYFRNRKRFNKNNIKIMFIYTF